MKCDHTMQLLQYSNDLIAQRKKIEAQAELIVRQRAEIKLLHWRVRHLETKLLRVALPRETA